MPNYGNPYGTLGPSPRRVARIDAARRKKRPGSGASVPPPTRPVPAPDGVDAQLYSQFRPLLEAIMFERAQREQYNSRRIRDLAGFTKTLMGNLGGVAPQITGAYEGASGAMSGLGAGYGQSLNAAQAADAGRINDVLRTIGAPEGQQASGGDVGSVLSGLAGWIPSQMLGQQGQALGAAAAELPETAGIQAQIELHKILGQSKEEDSEFESQIRQLLQKVPGARAALESDASQARLAETKVRLDQINDDRNYWLKTQAYYMSVGKFKLAKQAEKRAQQAEQRYAYETQGRDAYGNVAPGYKQLPNGTIVPRYKPAAPRAKGAGKTLTPNAKAEILQGVLRQEKDMVKDALPGIAKQSGLDKLYTMVGPADPKKLKAARTKAAKLLWERYSGQAITPESKRALRKMIARIVRDYAPAASTGSGLTEGLLP